MHDRLAIARWTNEGGYVPSENGEPGRHAHAPRPVEAPGTSTAPLRGEAPGQQDRGVEPTTVGGPLRIWSVGHSTHSLADFLALLAAHGIEVVADIRSVPKSRRHPQFHIDALAASLPEHGLLYRHLPQLGGLRSPRRNSTNDAWRNRSFRGYADYALTIEFAAGLSALRRIAENAPTAMMCAEALWWRCHRRLVADRLVAGGDTVLHIASNGGSSAHELTSFARCNVNGTITYVAGDPSESGTR